MVSAISSGALGPHRPARVCPYDWLPAGVVVASLGIAEPDDEAQAQGAETMTAADSLAAQIDAITAAIERARTFEHEHGLSTMATRKRPANTLRELRRWQHAIDPAGRSATVCNRIAATAPGDNGQPTAGQQVDTCQGAPTMPASPTVGVRIPLDLRQRAEDQARREDRSFSQVVRRALAAHLSDREPSKQERAA